MNQWNTMDTATKAIEHPIICFVPSKLSTKEFPDGWFGPVIWLDGTDDMPEGWYAEIIADEETREKYPGIYSCTPVEPLYWIAIPLLPEEE